MFNISRAAGSQSFAFKGSRKVSKSNVIKENANNGGSLNPFKKNKNIKAVNQDGDVFVKTKKDGAKNASRSFISAIYTTPEHYWS